MTLVAKDIHSLQRGQEIKVIPAGCPIPARLGWVCSNKMYSPPMQQKKIIFRVPSKKIKALDSLAGTRRLSRTDILNEAIDEYLALNEQWKAQIREGIRQADAGETIPHEEVLRRFASLSASHEA